MTSPSPPSRRTRRYFPRRVTPVTFLPSNLDANSARFLCRRTERAPLVSTALIRFPVTSRSRSRRTTSTSGNSGILVLPPATLRPAVCPRDFVVRRGISAGSALWKAVGVNVDLSQPQPRGLGSRLLGLLLRPALAGSAGLTIEQDG